MSVSKEREQPCKNSASVAVLTILLGTENSATRTPRMWNYKNTTHTNFIGTVNAVKSTRFTQIYI